MKLCAAVLCCQQLGQPECGFMYKKLANAWGDEGTQASRHNIKLSAPPTTTTHSAEKVWKGKKIARALTGNDRYEAAEQSGVCTVGSLIGFIVEHDELRQSSREAEKVSCLVRERHGWWGVVWCGVDWD